MFLNNRFYLMNKDHKILEFTYNMTGFGIEFNEINTFDSQRPYGFHDIHSWIANRQAPKHRQYIEKLLKDCGCDNLEGFIRVTHALSLNDTFWIKPMDSDFLWKDVSLYTNPFDETIAQIAFEGGLYGKEFTSTTPEFGTSGTFAKCWMREKNDIYMLKRGSEGAINAGLEPYSEAYASQISRIICKDTVNYDLTTYHGKLASKCKLFTSEKLGYVPIAKFFNGPVYPQTVFNLFSKHGAEDDFRRMLILDALILNTDRHMGNYGFMVNNQTMEIVKMAPMFDHNLSLLPYAMKDDFSHLTEYLSTRPTRIGEDFNAVAHSLLTPELKAELINMKDFVFDRSGKFNLPDERMNILDHIVQMQASNILQNVRLYVPENTKNIIKNKENSYSEIAKIETLEEER